MDQVLPEWDESDRIESRYANCFRVGANETEMIIEFAQCSSGQRTVRAHTCIVTHPTYAKRLLEVLRKSLDESYQTGVTGEGSH
jgi:hypothetical protein